MQNNNIKVPDYMEGEIKKYGSSVLDYVKDEPEFDNESVFTEELMKSTDVDKEREFLKSEDNGPVSEVITTDSISGVKNSQVTNDSDDYNTISDIINERDIKGRTLSRSGIEMIKDLLKDDPTEEELAYISDKLETIRVDDPALFEYHPEELDIEQSEDILGKRISDKIATITKDVKEYKSVMSRFCQQLYNTYQYVVRYNDDMRQLNKLAKKVDDFSKDMGDKEIPDLDNASESALAENLYNLNDIQNTISDFMNSIKNLDSRNSKLRQDYTLDDYDIRTVESIKSCLDNAIGFTRVYNKIYNAHEILGRNINDQKEINSSIENWIKDIKNDPHTLYTFPVNDYFTLEESRERIIEFFYNAILIYNELENSEDVIPDDVTDLELYLKDSGKITDDDISVYVCQAELVLYLLSRTFKHKKIKTDSDRRILSYTLDMVSKLGVKEYREAFVKLADYAYDVIYMGDEPNIIITDLD